VNSLCEKIDKDIEKVEENVDEIRRRLGPDNMVYNAIQSGYKRGNMAQDLLGGQTSSVTNLRGLVEIGDRRILSGGLRIDIAERKVVSTSFDEEWRCLACLHPHNGPAFKVRGVADSSCSPHAIILADQSVPAVLPVTSDQQCIKVLIVENSSLKQLCEEFLRLVGNRRVPKGTTVLLMSAAYLTEVGLVAYVDAFLSARQMLQEKLGKATYVLPLPLILIGGCDKEDTVRSILEFTAWSEDYFGEEDTFLEATTKAAREILKEQGSGSKKSKEYRRFLLPDKKSPSGKKIWNSGGAYSVEIPTLARAMSASQERKWVTTLVEEMRNKLALDLDPIPTLERGMGLQSKAKVKVDFLIVGSSNAARLSRALNEAGYTVCKILNSNWRITKESCETLAATVAQTIQQEEPGAVILHLLDASYYYTKSPDGSRTLPQKMADGKYHVCGKLVLASAETQNDHLQALKAILDVVVKRPCLVMSPIPRYVTEGCCADVRHVANRLDNGFCTDLQRQLDSATKRIKNFLFNSNRRNMRVLDSTYDIRDLPNEDIWFVDPVHPIDPIYRRIAAGVIKKAATLKGHEDGRDLKRRRDDSSEGNPRQPKPREAQSSRYGAQSWSDGRRGNYEQEPREAQSSRYGAQSWSDGRRGEYEQEPRESQNSRYGAQYRQDSRRDDGDRANQRGRGFRGRRLGGHRY
jgi:hypothetical protein